MYEVHDTGGFINRYLIFRNGQVKWYTTTLSGAKRWITRHKLNFAKPPTTMVPLNRRHPIVYQEEL